MKRILSLALVLVLITSIFTVCFANSSSANSDAKLLYSLGIVKGNGSGLTSLSLEKPVTRLSAAIVTLRLMGLDKEAVEYKGVSHFADSNKAAWAKPIMAYLKDHPEIGWTGSGENFNPAASVSAKEFTGKLLDILKYKEYSSDTLISYARTIGITSASNESAITLNLLTKLTVEALKVKVNGTKTTLAEYLVEKKKLNRDMADSEQLVVKLDSNILTMAAAWKQTAAEYKALYHQAFNIARMQVENAIKNHKQGDKPLAVVTDLDDTILLHDEYWGYLVNNDYDFFDDSVWDKMIPENRMKASPGSLEFLNYCKENGVEVYYVTSRDQGTKTYEYAMTNLKVLGFPYADDKHLTVLIDTSNKEKKQVEIAKDYNLVVYLGDNLNDFRRIYYVKDVDERTKLMEADKDLFGSKYILLPNPTDGHWVRAIFGDSEPASGNENRQIWEDAATHSIWKP